MSIKTWRERCDEHPDHNGIVTNRMIQERMQEEIDELRQAIEQAEQAQPVAWRYALDESVEGPRWIYIDQDPIRWLKGPAMIGVLIEPLYTAPPLRKPWVGLTGDEVNEFAAGCHLGNSVQGAIRKAEAKLKEKNT